MQAFDSTVDLSKLIKSSDHNQLAQNYDSAFRSKASQQAYIQSVAFFKQTKNWNSGLTIPDKLGMLQATS